MLSILCPCPVIARPPPPNPLAGLVFAYRFLEDGSSEQLDVEKPPAADGGWLWLHFNLADMRACQFLATTPQLPEPARALLVTADEHQQLQGGDACLYGVLADLVCGLSGATEEIGFLHFALTEKIFISSRRHQLNAIEATRKALRLGAKVQTPAVLLELIAGQMIASLDHFADGLADQLDHAEERILADELNVDRKVVGSVRRTTVRVHRQLVTLRALIQLRARNRGVRESVPQSTDEETHPAPRLARHGDRRAPRPLAAAAGRNHAEEQRADQSQPARARERHHRLPASESRRRYLWDECRRVAARHRSLRLPLGDGFDHCRPARGLLAVEALRHGWPVSFARRAEAAARRGGEKAR